MLKKVTEALPLLTLILIYYAYCNLYYYYNEFKVEIYSYISNSEILLSFLPTIVIVTATIGTYISTYLIGSATADKDLFDKRKNSNNPEQSLQELKTRRNRTINTIILVVVIVSLCLLVLNYYLLNYLNYRKYELREYFLYTSCIGPIVTYLAIYKIAGREIVMKYSYVISLFVILYIAREIGNFRKLEADEIKNSRSRYSLTFIYDKSKVITTSKDLVFIGQTQSAIFLFKKSDSSTLVFNRSSIDSLVIK